MSILLWLLFAACCASLTYFLGVRAERGKADRKRDQAEQAFIDRSRRKGGVVMNFVKIRR